MISFNSENVTKLIVKALVTEELEKTKSNYYQKQFGFLSNKVEALEKLKAALEEKETDEFVHFNIEVDIQPHNKFSHKNKIKTTTLLNIAVMYCRAPVVKYLLDHGAVADNKTIHHASKQYNKDMDNVIGVLEDYHVNLNTLNKKGHTALYVAKRKKNNEAAIALSNHHATMRFSEKIQAPVLNTIDKIKEVKNKVEVAIFAPGIRGC